MSLLFLAFDPFFVADGMCEKEAVGNRGEGIVKHVFHSCAISR
jgi:hypothetical protein